MGEHGESGQVVAAALALLARREHSAVELNRKLIGRGFAAPDITSAIATLEARGWLSNERFVEAYVRSRIARGHGPLKIRAELRERGIEDALADASLTETSSFWTARAAAARSKRFGDEPPPDRHAWTRQARFLAQRGFPADLIYRVLDGADD
jgi:regulatory protein